MSLPSRDLLLHSRRNCPLYNKAHFFDKGRFDPNLFSAYCVNAVSAFNTTQSKFHYHPSAQGSPKLTSSLKDDSGSERADKSVLLFASYILIGKLPLSSFSRHI